MLPHQFLLQDTCLLHCCRINRDIYLLACFFDRIDHATGQWRLFLVHVICDLLTLEWSHRRALMGIQAMGKFVHTQFLGEFFFKNRAIFSGGESRQASSEKYLKGPCGRVLNENVLSSKHFFMSILCNWHFSETRHNLVFLFQMLPSEFVTNCSWNYSKYRGDANARRTWVNMKNSMWWNHEYIIFQLNAAMWGLILVGVSHLRCD